MKLAALFVGLSLSSFAFAQKKPLDHTVYDQWQSIKETIIQGQGKFIVYNIVPQEGDGQLVIRNIESKEEVFIPRGTQANFSEDGMFVFGKIKPLFAETRKAKIEKKKADELPKDSLFIYDIKNTHLEKIANVKSFQTPSKANGSLVYLLDKKGDINKDGSELVIHNLKTRFKHSFKNVAQYALNPNGQQVIVYQVPTKTSKIGRAHV